MRLSHFNYCSFDYLKNASPTSSVVWLLFYLFKKILLLISLFFILIIVLNIYLKIAIEFIYIFKKRKLVFLLIESCRYKRIIVLTIVIVCSVLFFLFFKNKTKKNYLK